MAKKKNNNLWYILGGAVIFVLVLWIVLANAGNNKVVCNPPYIQVGQSCCLDENTNNVCDSDETTQQNTNNQQSSSNNEPTIYCGDETCQSSESCSDCPSDCGDCPIEKECNVYHTSGGWFSEMYNIPAGQTYWIENSCGYVYEGENLPSESNTLVGNRYCDGNVLVDEYFTCQSNTCIEDARRFNCAELAENGKCQDDNGRPECYFITGSGEKQIITTN